MSYQDQSQQHPTREYAEAGEQYGQPPRFEDYRSRPAPAPDYHPNHYHAPVAADPTAPAAGRGLALLVPLLVGSAVALTLGVYGNLHTGTGIAVNVIGFSGPLSVKTWLTTGALLFALAQLGSALVMYGKVPGLAAPPWIGTAHRWSGRIAFLLAVPVAMHCLYAVGFQTFELRVAVHSLLGCVFFGAFTVKMLALRKPGLPGWALPVLGGLVFAGLVGLWWTSALWFFQTYGFAY